MKVGAHTYAHDAPTDGSSGFFLVRLNSRTLALDKDFFYVTNRPDGTQIPDEARADGRRHRLGIGEGQCARGAAADAPSVRQSRRGPVPACCRRHRRSGTSAATPRCSHSSIRGPATSRIRVDTRRCALVHGRAGGRVEPIPDRARGHGKLHGLLVRARDAQYQPAIADAAGTVNFDLVSIVNRPTSCGRRVFRVHRRTGGRR